MCIISLVNPPAMRIQVQALSSRVSTEAIVIAYFVKANLEKHSLWRTLRASERVLIQRLVRTKDFSGKTGEAKIVYRTGGGKVVLLGLGEEKKWNQRSLVLAARQAMVVAKAEKVTSVGLALESFMLPGMSIDRVAQALAENAVMAVYDFPNYKKEKIPVKLKSASFFVNASEFAAAQRGVSAGVIIGEQVNLARDLGNIPGGEMTPTMLAQKAVEVGKQTGVKVQVMGHDALKKLGAGAILGVAHGSSEEPKFIIMEYRGASASEKPYVFVGKGVTFDSGGLNLKPGVHMNDMHLDMLGGAAVIAALGAIAKLKLKVNVVGLVPSVENMPGSAGYRPGDLLKGLSGKTIEVLDTDAEGRVILSDALTYAERYKPKLVVDVATLTGACMVALGLKTAGLFTPEKELQIKLTEVGERSGDYVWPLPLWEEHEADIKGTFGDVQNVGRKGRYGDAINGAAFLWQFAKKYPWAHLDVAGPMKTVEGQFLAKGASGVAVRFLVELVR